MHQIKEGDFIEVEYTGRLKEGNLVFDTTYENTAKESGIHSSNTDYGPVIICLGQGQLIPGLEKAMEGREIGKEYDIELKPEEAFGKKDAKLIRMIPFAAFKKQKIFPEPGMQVNIDGVMGIIKTAAGGRCLVDFNHPLSGKEVVYKIKANRIVAEDKEKVKAYVSLALNVKDFSVEMHEGKAEIISKKEIPKEIQDVMSKQVKEVIPSVKELNFKTEKEPAKDILKK